MIILDTNVISESIKPKPEPMVLRWLDRQAPVTLYYTTISAAELLAGFRLMPAGKRRTQLDSALADEIAATFGNRILPFDAHAASFFGDVVAAANAAGNPINFPDAAIASIALAHDYMLATRNQRDFNGVAVKLINPWS